MSDAASTNYELLMKERLKWADQYEILVSTIKVLLPFANEATVTTVKAALKGIVTLGD